MLDGKFTVTELCDLFEEPPERVKYIISKLRLRPIARVGAIRLFDQQQMRVIKEGLFNIQIRSS